MYKLHRIVQISWFVVKMVQMRTQENPNNEPNVEEEVKVKKPLGKHEKSFDLLRRMAMWALESLSIAFELL
jgi:hypothetical protein